MPTKAPENFEFTRGRSQSDQYDDVLDGDKWVLIAGEDFKNVNTIRQTLRNRAITLGYTTVKTKVDSDGNLVVQATHDEVAPRASNGQRKTKAKATA